jgi:7-cyano-7-deazaguanine synthase
MQKHIGVCLVSGGMDSCVTAAIARKEVGNLAFLHADYGQRTLERERRAFYDLANFFNVEHVLSVNLDYFSLIGGSALTDKNLEVPKGEIGRLGIPITYVPFRNANLLSIATSWAEALGASYIYIGAVAEDSSGYPDCRPEFYEAFQRVIDLGTRPETNIIIKTPVINLKKSEIVRWGLELGAPFHLTWSCYKREDVACGECDSCLLRLRGFREAGASDPIPYLSREMLPS